jgi:DNA-binding response OmpR family regulator
VTESVGGSHAQTTILLVDGSGDSAAWLRNHLEVEGLRVLVATDASGALDMMRSQSPALVVLCAMALFTNVHSGDAGDEAWLAGGRFLQRLRRDRGVGVITLSRERGAAKRAHPVDFGDKHLTWPFGRQRLMACIQAVLRQATSAARDEG